MKELCEVALTVAVRVERHEDLFVERGGGGSDLALCVCTASLWRGRQLQP